MLTPGHTNAKALITPLERLSISIKPIKQQLHIMADRVLIEDMPQMPETEGFYQIYKDSWGSVDLIGAEWSLDSFSPLAIAGITLGSSAVIGAATMAAYSYFWGEKETPKEEETSKEEETPKVEETQTDPRPRDSHGKFLPQGHEVPPY